MKQLLHVGCGRKSALGQPLFPAAHWQETTLDIVPGLRPDIVASMTDMPMVPNDRFDAVFSSHNLEHLFPHELKKALSEFLRVLKPGGMAAVYVPDIQNAVEAIAQGRSDEPLYMSDSGPIYPFDVIYGHAPSIEGGHVEMAHRNGFTVQSLHRAIKDAGFTAVQVKRRGINLVSVAYKGHRPATSPWLNPPCYEG